MITLCSGGQESTGLVLRGRGGGLADLASHWRPERLLIENGGFGGEWIGDMQSSVSYGVLVFLRGGRVNADGGDVVRARKPDHDFVVREVDLSLRGIRVQKHVQSYVERDICSRPEPASADPRPRPP